MPMKLNERRCLKADETSSTSAALERLPLRELNLFETGPNGFMDAGTYRSIARIPTLETLTINKLDWNLLDVLAESAVTRLEVTHANGIPFGELRRLRGLRSLYFYSDDGEILGAEAFDFPALEWLDIKNVEMESLRCLSGLRALKTLHIYASTCRDYAGLEELTGLEEIYCTGDQRAALRLRYPAAAWEYR